MTKGNTSKRNIVVATHGQSYQRERITDFGREQNLALAGKLQAQFGQASSAIVAGAFPVYEQTGDHIASVMPNITPIELDENGGLIAAPQSEERMAKTKTLGHNSADPFLKTDMWQQLPDEVVTLILVTNPKLAEQAGVFLTGERNYGKFALKQAAASVFSFEGGWADISAVNSGQGIEGPAIAFEASLDAGLTT